MAQTMLFMSGVTTRQVVNLKRDPLLQVQIEKLKPKPFSSLLFSPLPTKTSFSSKSLTTFAIFKSKAKSFIGKNWDAYNQNRFKISTTHTH